MHHFDGEMLSFLAVEYRRCGCADEEVRILRTFHYKYIRTSDIDAIPVSCLHITYLQSSLDVMIIIVSLVIICIITIESEGIAQNHRPRKVLKIDPYHFEQSLRSRGYSYIVGSDDTGRGAIAGPVMTASCCLLLPPELSQTQIHAILMNETHELFSMVHDSKLLTEDVRNIIYGQIMNKPHLYAYAYAHIDAEEIDQINIQKASMKCFTESIEALVTEYSLPIDRTYCMVDGAKSPKLKFPTPCRPYVKGDAHILTISLASIIAKVKRDRYMTTEAHALYPQYGFDVHKGYATRDHIMAIHKFGPSPLHRMSFRSLKGR